MLDFGADVGKATESLTLAPAAQVAALDHIKRSAPSACYRAYSRRSFFRKLRVAGWYDIE